MIVLAPTALTVYSFKDIKNCICKILDIPDNSLYYKYNDIDYNIQEFFLDWVVPASAFDTLFDNSITYLYTIPQDVYGWFKDTGQIHNTNLANAYHIVYNMLCGGTESSTGVCVQWFWE